MIDTELAFCTIRTQRFLLVTSIGYVGLQFVGTFLSTNGDRESAIAHASFPSPATGCSAGIDPLTCRLIHTYCPFCFDFLVNRSQAA
jgi:hypothetical protein